MAKVADIFAFVDGLAPFDTAMDFDNVGLLVGDMDAEVRKCVVALDVTAAVVDEAERLGASLIVSHHPVIFTPLKSLQANSIPYVLAKRGIAAICAHTNLDIAAFGVNTCLAEALSLQNLIPLSTYETCRGALPMGLVGELEIEKAYEEFARFVKERLSCEGIRYIDVSRKIRRVAVCSGSGGDLIGEAVRQNVDAFVTGEIKHHELLAAAQSGICVVDSGHFKSEDIVILPLVRRLSEQFPAVKFVKSAVCTDGIKFLV